MAVNIYLARLETLLGPRYSVHTRRNTLRHSGVFLETAGMKKQYTRQDMLLYLDKLVNHGYSERSIHVIMSGVKALFIANDLHWPLNRMDMHLGLPQEENRGPSLSEHEMRELITYGRALPHPYRTLVALASVYGLRQQELAEVMSVGCNGETLTVQTAKGGRARIHQIPAFLRPVLTFPSTPIYPRKLHIWFDDIMSKGVRAPMRLEGWHAIRRSVVTALYRNDVPETIIHEWMGWRQAPSIGRRYYRPEPGETDAKVFAKHPYARLWLPKGG